MMIDDVQPNEDLQWCDTCRDHVPGTCDACRRPFERGEATYKSQSFHIHPASIAGISGTRSIHKALCVDCYRIDFAKVYPKLEVPTLPDRPASAVLPEMVQERVA